MAFGVLAAGAAIKGIGRRRSAKKQKKADKRAIAEQERLDAENRELYRAEVGESVRRTEISNRETEGFASAQIGASGFGGGSSLDTFFESMQETHASDVDWMETSGASNIAIQERESAARARTGRAQSKINYRSESWAAVGGMFSDIGGAYRW